MVAANEFRYDLAFSRNLGWITEAEQQKLRNVHVGIIGMGGVGGQYSEILARLGVGRFTICDHDTFSVENTNRQNECKASNYGRNKAEVIRDLILDINPSAEVQVIAGPLQFTDVKRLCQNVDVYIDALDFFSFDLRIEIFREMKKLGKPAMTIAPVGCGAAFVAFTEDSMSFDDYFGLHLTNDLSERSLRFVLGLTPSLQQFKYLKERNRADFRNRKVPSLAIGVYASAAVGAANMMKIVLQRGGISVAPWSIHYDSYLGQVKRKLIFWGFRNPLQRLKLILMRRLSAS